MEKVIFFWFFIGVLAILCRCTILMAKFKSTVFSSASGKIGGQVFRTTSGGMVVSGKPSSVRKRTYDNTAWRTRVGYVSALWKTLTEAQRTTWRDRAVDGLSGFQLFCKHNLNRLGAGEFITTSPVLTAPPAIGLIGIAPSVYTIVAGGTKSITIVTVGAGVSDWSLQVQSTDPLGRGVQRTNNNRFNQIQNFSNPRTGTYTFTTNFNFFISNLAGKAGQKVVIRVRAYHRVFGYATPWIYNSHIIT